MRISEERYARDIRRINLAHRMIQLEVRTQWICQWTGLSAERVRNLARSYRRSQDGLVRHRGPAPHLIQPLMRSTTLRNEAGALGGLAVALRLVPAEKTPNARKSLPGIALGEQACLTYEIYRASVPLAQLTMDIFLLLLCSLSEDPNLTIEQCSSCDGTLLVDHLAGARQTCDWCRQARREKRPESVWSAQSVLNREAVTERDGGSSTLQQTLF